MDKNILITTALWKRSQDGCYRNKNAFIKKGYNNVVVVDLFTEHIQITEAIKRHILKVMIWQGLFKAYFGSESLR